MKTPRSLKETEVSSFVGEKNSKEQQKKVLMEKIEEVGREVEFRRKEFEALEGMLENQ